MRTLSAVVVVLVALGATACKKQEPVAAAVVVPPADGPALGDLLGVFSSLKVSAGDAEPERIGGVSVTSVLNYVDLDEGTHTTFEGCATSVGLHFLDREGGSRGVLKPCVGNPNKAMFESSDGKKMAFHGIFNGKGLVGLVSGASLAQ